MGVGVAVAGTGVLGSVVVVGAFVGVITVGNASICVGIAGKTATADGGRSAGGELHAANPKTMIINTIQLRRHINPVPLLNYRGFRCASFRQFRVTAFSLFPFPSPPPLSQHGRGADECTAGLRTRLFLLTPNT